jgi:hypothetical protein
VTHKFGFFNIPKGYRVVGFGDWDPDPDPEGDFECLE